jgi:glycosyltransferase involved in cell wall biosynthesis
VSDRVTVIIPTFNRSAYLECALASVLAQEGVGFRVLVCDNASTDGTHDAVSRHPDPRVTYVRRPENVGWLRNFNLGLAEVATDYVTLLGDDDVMLPGALSRAVEALDATPTASFVHTAFDLIDGGGRTIARRESWTRGLESDTVEPGSVFIQRSMPWACRVSCPSAVMRMAVLPDPAFDPTDEPVSDLALWLRMALRHDVLYLATPGIEMRTHDGRASDGWNTVSADAVEAHEFDVIMWVRDAKRRFLDEHADELDDVRGLRRDVGECVAGELITSVRATSADGRAALLRAWCRAVRTEPRMLLRPRTWMLLARVVLGHGLSERLRGR